MADGHTEYTLRWKQHWKLLQQDDVTNKFIYIYICNHTKNRVHLKWITVIVSSLYIVLSISRSNWRYRESL